jgi:3-oxoadipate enol-lactonase
MPIIAQNNTNIYYEVSGEGCPLILGHSFLCSGEMWTPQIGPLAERCQVLNVDLRGHGKSGLINRPFDLYDLVDDVLAVLDHQGIERAVWAGLSIGGMVALRAALVANNRVSGLILLDTHAGAETTLKKLKYRAMALAAKVTGTGPLLPQVVRMFFSSHTRSTKPELINEWKAKFASVPLSSILHTVEALRRRDSIVERLGEIQVPALVIVGEKDQALPPSYSKEIAGALPNASLVVIEQSGHLPTLEQPEAVTSAMLSFLAGQPE